MKIASIVETSFENRLSSWSGFDGFVVTLEDGVEIKLGIENGQSCCENWGYLISEDNLSDYIGAEYQGVEVVDTKLATIELNGTYESDCMFVNINTSKGVLQFVAYNEHNGYYGHDAVVIEDGSFVHRTTL